MRQASAAMRQASSRSSKMASVLPGVGRQGHLWLDREPVDGGFLVKAVLAGRPQRVGWVSSDHPELFEAIHVADSLLRSPAAFAHFLEAASSDVLARGGALLSRRIFPE